MGKCGREEREREEGGREGERERETDDYYISCNPHSTHTLTLVLLITLVQKLLG